MQLLPSFWATLAWAMGSACESLAVCVGERFSLHFSFAAVAAFSSRKRKSSACVPAADWSRFAQPSPLPWGLPRPIEQHNDNCRNIFVLAVEQHTHFIVHPLCDGLNDHSSHTQLQLQRLTFHVYIQQLAISLAWNASACRMKCLKTLVEIRKRNTLMCYGTSKFWISNGDLIRNNSMWNPRNVYIFYSQKIIYIIYI